MGNKLYVTKVPTPNFKIMHPDNTVICQVKFHVQLWKQLKKQQKQQKQDL
jgi:large subunit ribosomal protein L25